MGVASIRQDEATASFFCLRAFCKLLGLHVSVQFSVNGTDMMSYVINFTSAEGGYVFTSVCLSVCLFVCLSCPSDN